MADPLAHIKDEPLIGMDANTGQILWRPAPHGHPKLIGSVPYTPKKIGPFRAEFTQHMMNVLVIALLLAIIITGIVRKVLSHVRSDQAPKGKLANAVEFIYVFIRDEVVLANGGHHVVAYTPIFMTYFLFILCLNYAGMVPLFGGATGNIAVTATMGGSILILLTCLGIYKQGPVAYFLHMVPPSTPWWLWPGMFMLEFAGPIIKSFVLCMRLFGNMIAGHLVISNVLVMGTFGVGAPLKGGLAVFMLVVGVPIALGASALEVLVCGLQAYVFTMLAVIFVSAAVHPEH